MRTPTRIVTACFGSVLLLVIGLLGSPLVLAQDAAPEPTAEPLSLNATQALPILVSARGDLELLASDYYGSSDRPAGWSGSLDVTNPQLPILTRLDLEILADLILADKGGRPQDWFGVVASSPLAIARDIRHDLELLATAHVGAPGIRPAGWKGDDPLMACSRATQALLPVLLRSGAVISVDFNQPDACRQAELQASVYVETQIIQPSVTAARTQTSGMAEPYIVNSEFVVAFLDRTARQRAGVIPNGTGFRPMARSYTSFSNMMLVRGEDFSVFVDYMYTTVTQEEFAALPNVDSTGGSTACNAVWCG